MDQLCDGVETRRSLALVLFLVIKDRADGRLRREERQVLQIYEDVALKKKERFDALQRIAKRVQEMPERYHDSFIKQLGNTRSKDRFLELLKQFGKSERLTVTKDELRIIDSGPANELITLLYLLCVAEE
jgi:Tfp pilus assembly protein PilO